MDLQRSYGISHELLRTVTDPKTPGVMMTAMGKLVVFKNPEWVFCLLHCRGLQNPFTVCFTLVVFKNPEWVLSLLHCCVLQKPWVSPLFASLLCSSKTWVSPLFASLSGSSKTLSEFSVCFTLVIFKNHKCVFRFIHSFGLQDPRVILLFASLSCSKTLSESSVYFSGPTEVELYAWWQFLLFRMNITCNSKTVQLDFMLFFILLCYY